MKTVSKAEEILGLAQRLIQTRGYNGFSFRDLADEIGIKSASIHYHFPTKADLVREVASRYREEFAEAVAEMQAQSKSSMQILAGYVELFHSTLTTEKRVCLCGMLASEAESLPDTVRQETTQFFQDQEDWLAGILNEGIADGKLLPSLDARAGAKNT